MCNTAGAAGLMPQYYCSTAGTANFTLVKHFLLDCQNYHQIRNRTLSDFLHLPTKSLLCGDPRLTEEENINIYEAVHKFITQTGRFDN